jgi:drug/metabolite transporter (DMT)-like permease
MPSEAGAKIPRRGYYYAVLAALLWGVSGSSAKYLFNTGISAFQVVQLRLTITAAALLVWLLLRRPGLLRIAWRDVLYFAVLGVCGFAVNQFAYLFAISRINVAAAILLQYLAPAFITAYAAVVTRERPSPGILTALAGATAGCYLVVGAYNIELLALNLTGIAAGLGAALSFAWYSLHSEYGMRRYPPWTVLFYAMVFAALVWNVIHPPLEAFRHAYTPSQWAWILYIGVLGTAVPFALFLEGINRIRSTRASITAFLEPITAGVWASLFLNENMDGLQVAGGALVIASIVLIQVRRERDALTPELLRAKARQRGVSAADHGRDAARQTELQ